MKSYYRNKKALEFLDYDYYFSDAVFSRSLYYIPLLNNTVKEKDKIIEFIQALIDKDKYVAHILDKYVAINNKIMQKGCLLNAYDNDKKEFSLYFCEKNGYWQPDRINYYEYIDLIKPQIIENDDGLFRVNVFWNHVNFDEKFDIDKMRGEMECYLSDAEDINSNELYGQNALSTCVQDFLNDLNNDRGVAINSLYTLISHKKMMIERLKFIQSGNIMENNLHDIYNEYRTVYKYCINKREKDYKKEINDILKKNVIEDIRLSKNIFEYMDQTPFVNKY